MKTTFERLPLRWSMPTATDSACAGAAAAFALRPSLGQRGWRWRDRVALLRAASTWATQGFRCVARSHGRAAVRRPAEKVRADLIDPLCVAALNTPADEASGAVFLRVLKDALWSAGRGSSDLLLPRSNLSALFPDAAHAPGSSTAGATIRLAPSGDRGSSATAPLARRRRQPFDARRAGRQPVEAARLVGAARAAWADAAGSLALRADRHRLRTRQRHTTASAYAGACAPTTDAPAQFVFDHGLLGGPAGLLAFVVSGAAPGSSAASPLPRRELAQARARTCSLSAPTSAPRSAIVEKRATFVCTPGLRRPPAASLRACSQPATTWPAPTRPRSRARCAAGVAAARAAGGSIGRKSGK